MKRYVDKGMQFLSSAEQWSDCHWSEFQVRERLRVALERNGTLEEELNTLKDEVSLFKVYTAPTGF